MSELSAYNLYPKLVLELALDIRPLPVVAEQFSLSLAELESIMAQPYFNKQVQLKRAELEKNGSLFRAKCAAMADEGLVDMWAMFSDVEAPRAHRFDIWKYLVKMGDLEPKQATVPVGSGFSITINIPGAAPVTDTPAASIIEGKLVQPTEEWFKLDLPSYIPTSTAASDDLVFE